MNRKQYNSDTRYAKVLEKMDLLGIMDVSTTRQSKNGTITWKLPIKNEWSKLCIEVASFKSGYVRNQGVSCHSNYQLNKRCESEPEYYPVYEWCDKRDMNVKTDKFRQYTTRTCKLIPIEIDRLEYLISYCLKNYYIKNANQVADGKFVPKWQLENAQNGMVSKWKYDEAINLGKANDCDHYERIKDLEDKLEEANKEIERITENNYVEPLRNLSVTVNGVNYEII